MKTFLAALRWIFCPAVVYPRKVTRWETSNGELWKNPISARVMQDMIDRAADSNFN